MGTVEISTLKRQQLLESLTRIASQIPGKRAVDCLGEKLDSCMLLFLPHFSVSSRLKMKFIIMFTLAVFVVCTHQACPNDRFIQKHLCIDCRDTEREAEEKSAERYGTVDESGTPNSVLIGRLVDTQPLAAGNWWLDGNGHCVRTNGNYLSTYLCSGSSKGDCTRRSLCNGAHDPNTGHLFYNENGVNQMICLGWRPVGGGK